MNTVYPLFHPLVTIIRCNTDIVLMQDQEILREILRKSRETPAFPLSDLFREGGGRGPAANLIEPVLNRLKLFGLKAEKEGSDYLITRCGPIPFTISGKERTACDAFLAHPEVPDRLQRLIGDYLRKKTGKDWQDPVTLERIRSAIMMQKGEYWREGGHKKIRYEKGYRVFAYLAYQFPVYFAQFEHILAMLAEMGMLYEHMSVLDAGSGPGSSSLAITDFLSRAGHGTAEIFALELSGEQREAYSFLTSGFADGIGRIVIHPVIEGDIRNIEPGSLPGKIDLLIFQNVLNELSDLDVRERAGRVDRLSEVLSPDGIVLIVEPADLVNSVGLRELACELSRRHGFSVISPCVGNLTRACLPERCWSFVEKPPVRATRLMEAVSAGPESYRFRNTDIKFSYVILSKNAKQPSGGPLPFDKKTAPLSSLSRHVGKKINVTALVMSGDLGNQRTHLWKLCDGTPQIPVYAVLPSYHASPGNRMISNVPYGQRIRLSGVSVRYNSRYDAYNLLISRETKISIPGKSFTGKRGGEPG